MASRALASRVAPRMRALAQPQLAAAVGPALVVPQAPASRRGIVHAESIGTVVQVGKQSQWTAFMYGRERQLLEHVVNNVEEGDVDGLLAAMDEFWATHFQMKGTATWSVRKDLLDKTITDKAPQRAIELGTYCGYSALRIARKLPDGGKLVSIEVDPLFSAIAARIVEYARMQDKVKVLTGTVETRVNRLKECLAQPGQALEEVKSDFILCDHSKERFVPDLELLEQSGLAGPGTVVMGDTTLYPGDNKDGGADLLSHFAKDGKYRVAQHVGTEGKSGLTVCEWQHIV